MSQSSKDGPTQKMNLSCLLLLLFQPDKTDTKKFPRKGNSGGGGGGGWGSGGGGGGGGGGGPRKRMGTVNTGPSGSSFLFLGRRGLTSYACLSRELGQELLWVRPARVSKTLTVRNRDVYLHRLVNNVLIICIGVPTLGQTRASSASAFQERSMTCCARLSPLFARQEHHGTDAVASDPNRNVSALSLEPIHSSSTSTVSPSFASAATSSRSVFRGR